MNSGHNTCFVLRPVKKLIELKQEGIPLGIINGEFPYQSENSILQKGDRLLLYTDGIPKDINARGKFYEDAGRFKKIILNGHKTTKDFIQHLVNDINDFVGDAEQSNDITAFYLVKQQ
jgi:sigma-B regulation protein RsbU (phosphoserine phosphatase)